MQVSDVPSFAERVVTLFNNDYDNSAGLGKGADKEYYEDHFGRRIAGKGVKVHYVRITSHGNTSGPYNRFTEIEVYGQ